MRQGVRQAREVGGQERRSDPDVHDVGAAPGASGGRDTVRETTSRLERGYPAGGNCFRIVFGLDALVGLEPGAADAESELLQARP